MPDDRVHECAGQIARAFHLRSGGDLPGLVGACIPELEVQNARFGPYQPTVGVTHPAKTAR
jgi:hypothetical protein